MNEAIEKYREHLTEKELKPISVDTTEYRLRCFFIDPELELIDLSAKRCGRLYEQLRQRKVRRDRLISTDSQRGALSEVKTFLDWGGGESGEWYRAGRAEEARQAAAARR